MSKDLYILIGIKGSGKTTIGHMIMKRFGYRFLSVELYFKQWQSEAQLGGHVLEAHGYPKLLRLIEEEFNSTDTLIFESLGADYFGDFLAVLEMKYNVRLIHVLAPIETCVRRVVERNEKLPTKHILMTSEKIMEINKIAATVKFDYCLTIENDPLVSEEEIVEKFQPIVGTKGLENKAETRSFEQLAGMKPGHK